MKFSCVWGRVPKTGCNSEIWDGLILQVAIWDGDILQGQSQGLSKPWLFVNCSGIYPTSIGFVKSNGKWAFPQISNH